MEYEEKIAEKTTNSVALNVVSLIKETINTVYVDLHYRWSLITSDPDDNKFSDAAIAGNADYLVTNDAHFNEAKTIHFPKINIITGERFLIILNSN